MASTHEKVGYPPGGEEFIPYSAEDWCADAAEEGFRLLEGRWKMMIVFHLFARPVLRFSELERLIPLVSQKMLAQQLRDLEQKRIVRRMVHAEVPPRVDYRLTELGLALRPALSELVRWAKRRRRQAAEGPALPGA